jgi:DNA segregation ATPase FtsK/SpoIIIE-like protein
MLAEGTAYRCYCSKERLDVLRNEQQLNKQKPRYDGHCRDLKQHPENQPYVIRFRNPSTGEVIVDDKVHGPVVFQNSELDDLFKDVVKIVTQFDRASSSLFQRRMDIGYAKYGRFSHLSFSPYFVSQVLTRNKPHPQFFAGFFMHSILLFVV